MGYKNLKKYDAPVEDLQFGVRTIEKSFNAAEIREKMKNLHDPIKQFLEHLSKSKLGKEHVVLFSTKV